MKPKRFLEKLSAFLRDNDYDVIFATGVFSGGHCIINENNVVVINKHMPVEEQLRICVSVILEHQLDYSELKKEIQSYIQRYIPR
ncbi:MAG: hypothetical protein R6V48_05300 [Fidelibacterota bacterium]